MIFDANVSYGPVYRPSLTPCRTPDELRDALVWSRTDRALVIADVVRDGAPATMNHLAAREMKDFPELEPVWAALPFATGEMGTPEQFFASMGEYGVKALAAFPSVHKYLLDRLTCGDLLDGMVERKIPLILPLNESSHGLSRWALVADVLRGTPGLRLIVTGSGPWGDDRFFRPLLSKYEGLHLELSRYELDKGIPDLVKHYLSLIHI